VSDASKLARDHDEEAIKVIKSIMDDPFAEHKDRLKAAEALLDRGHGKAAQAIIAVPASRKLATELAALTDEQLYEIVQSEPLPRLPGPSVIDAEYEPTPIPDGEFDVLDDALDESIDPLLL
jgi:hypothetical protein